MSTQDVFRRIYGKNLWRNPESRSGWGSTVEGANGSQHVRSQLPMIFRSLGVRSVLDVPCGDFNWMRLVPLDDIIYLGLDVVPEVVARNNELYAAENVAFQVADAMIDSLPAVDLVMMRDLLIHLTNDQALSAVRRVLESGSGHLLVSNYARVARNRDTFTGGFRMVNLYRPPFDQLCLPPPVRSFTDGDGNRGRQLALVELAGDRRA